MCAARRRRSGGARRAGAAPPYPPSAVGRTRGLVCSTIVAQSSIQARSAAASAACGGALCSSSRARGGAAAALAPLTERWPAPRRAATAHPRRIISMRLWRISRRLRRPRGAAPASGALVSSSYYSVGARLVRRAGCEGWVRRASPRAEGMHRGQLAPEGGCRYTAHEAASAFFLARPRRVGPYIAASVQGRAACTLPSGQVAIYTERVYRAGNEEPKGSRFCVNPADFFSCVATRCVDKGQKCA